MVRIRGLSPSRNGAEGDLERFDRDTGQWDVKVSEGDKVSVKDGLSQYILHILTS